MLIIFTQNSRHTSALIERRNERIESGNESAEVKFLDKHSASGDSEGEYGYGLRLASQPASQLASHRGTCFFPLLSPLAFYLISSPLVAPLSPAFTHVCQRKGRSCGVCAHKRLYSVASRLCASLYARASVSHMRMSRQENKRREGGGSRTRIGWDKSLTGTTQLRSDLFRKCHAEYCPIMILRINLLIFLYSLYSLIFFSFFFFFIHFIVNKISPIVIVFDTVTKKQNFEITLHIYHTSNNPRISMRRTYTIDCYCIFEEDTRNRKQK